VAPKLAASLGTNLWPAGAPLVAQIFLAILIAELGHYWFHRVSHERPLVWRLHATHHSSKRLYWGNATRFHPFDLFALISLQSVPLLLLGIPESTFLGYSLFASVYGQLQHANIRLSTPRWLDWVFSSPGLHRWHHSPDPGEGNHNYGAILSSWDLVFGTFFRPCERTFGGKVGLSGLPEFPTRYVAQLASPFRWPPGR
jgi:sterol desaturase/sphingolipid hydroxylase (fatty acid hydroxylase superfamily)